LFFVHTAMVLMMSMERMGRSGCNLYSAFMVRRLFRIFPLSALSVLTAVTFRIPPTSWLGAYVWPGWPAILSNFFLTQNITQSNSVNCVLWSLPFEVQMYAILPLLFLFAQRHPSLTAPFLAELAAFSIAGFEYILRHCDAEFLITRYFPCFLAGVIAWRLTKAVSPRFSGIAWMFIVIFLIGAYRIVDVLRVYGPDALGAIRGRLRNDHRTQWPSYVDLVRDWFFCAVIGLAIPMFFEIRSRWLKVFSKLIARYSYGIYICHVPVFWLFFTKLHVGSVPTTAAISVIATAALSVLAHHCVEDPAIHMGKRLGARITQLSIASFSPSNYH
jgi:peptidoglycan/LPS O-acetylase OafA/YrhL